MALTPHQRLRLCDGGQKFVKTLTGQTIELYVEASSIHQRSESMLQQLPRET